MPAGYTEPATARPRQTAYEAPRDFSERTLTASNYIAIASFFGVYLLNTWPFHFWIMTLIRIYQP